MYETARNYHESLARLNAREQKFVSQYLICGNATQAAKRAGYSKRSAAEIGWENLRKPQIFAAVQAGLEAIAARCEVDANKLVRELAAVSFSNISHYHIDEEGYVALEEGAPPEAIKAVQSVRRKKIVKDDGTVIYQTEFRLWDKLNAFTLLGKKLKLWTEKAEVQNAQDLAYVALLAEVRAMQARGITLQPPVEKGE